MKRVWNNVEVSLAANLSDCSDNVYIDGTELLNISHIAIEKQQNGCAEITVTFLANVNQTMKT
jgi:hypothetical protein